MTRSSLFALLLVASLSLGCAERMATTSGSTDTAAQQGPVYTSTAAAPGEIPAGTQLVIRTNEEIKVQSDSSRTYDAEIESEVIGSDNRVLIPRRSPVQLMVFKSGEDQLELGIQSLRINGRTYRVQTGTVTRESGEGIGMNRRTATMVGGGAALGTLIGAVAGGAKGAVVGAAVGAAAGAGAQVLTKGKEVNVPAESVLTFRLDESIMLQEASSP
jgi:hypothetical protein